MDAMGLPWEVVHVTNANPTMANYSQYEMLTKDGYLIGSQSMMALVPELKGASPDWHRVPVA